MHELYISWVGGYSCYDNKCQMYSYLALCHLKKRKSLWHLFLDGFNSLKAKATSRRQFAFYH